jgi:cyclase
MAIPEWRTQFIEVGDRAFAYVQAGGGFCVANAGLLLTAQLLINSHHHVDHTLGNALFDAPILGHAAIREAMLRAGIPKERLISAAPHFAEELAKVRELRPPTQTFTGAMTLYDGDREIQLLHVGTAHTVGDTLVYLPQDRLLYAGDVAFHYVTPLAFEGHVSNWIAVLDHIDGMDVERIVPGHGPVGTKADLRELRDYFALVRDEARKAFDAGAAVEDAVREVASKLGRFAAWTESERVNANVRRLYQEFEGRLDVPLDLAHIAPRPAGTA